MTSIPGAALADKPLPVDSGAANQAGNLAQTFYRMSQAIDDYRISNWGHLSTADRGRLKDEAQALDTRAHYLTADALGNLLDPVQGSLKDIESVTTNADHALRVLNEVGQVISIATASVALAADIATGDPAAIGSGVKTLASTISQTLTAQS